VRLSCVGKGGSSKVFKVMDQELRIYALKRVSLEGADRTTIENYVNEINLLKKLRGKKTIIFLKDFEVNLNEQVIFLVSVLKCILFCNIRI
jgi:serine/threonine-protein kinase TTK/MPS1